MTRIATRTTAVLLALLTLGAGACSDGGPGSSAAHPEDDFTYAASHVHIASKGRKANATFERVLMVMKALREGMSIEEAARRWSDNKATADVGGWLGFMRLEASDAFSGAVQAVPLGQLGSPVETDEGFHIVYRHTFEEGREVERRYMIPAYGFFIPYGEGSLTKADAESKAKEAWDRVNRGELTLMEAAQRFTPIPPPRADAFIANVKKEGRHAEVYDVIRKAEPGELAPIGSVPGAFAVLRRGEKMRSHARHILIQHVESRGRALSVSRTKKDALALANKALAELDGDTSRWDAALRKYTDETHTLALRGWIGAITNGDLLPEMEMVLLATEPGRIADKVAESESGYHILWRVN